MTASIDRVNVFIRFLSIIFVVCRLAESNSSNRLSKFQAELIMAKYAVLRHELPANSLRNDHFDLLLENAGVLATWEIQSWPPVDSQPATRLADHRMTYLEYEGEVRDLGRVQRVCSGTFEFRQQANKNWIVKMTGESFQGLVQLTHQPQDSAAQRWILSVASGEAVRDDSAE